LLFFARKTPYKNKHKKIKGERKRDRFPKTSPKRKLSHPNINTTTNKNGRIIPTPVA
jgi:hypothetical protein